MPTTDKLAYMASLDFGGWEPKDICKCLADLGYGAVEYTMAQFDPRSRTDDEVRGAIEAAEDAGFQLSVIASTPESSITRAMVKTFEID